MKHIPRPKTRVHSPVLNTELITRIRLPGFKSRTHNQHTELPMLETYNLILYKIYILMKARPITRIYSPVLNAKPITRIHSLVLKAKHA